MFVFLALWVNAALAVYCLTFQDRDDFAEHFEQSGMIYPIVTRQRIPPILPIDTVNAYRYSLLRFEQQLRTERVTLIENIKRRRIFLQDGLTYYVQRVVLRPGGGFDVVATRVGDNASGELFAHYDVRLEVSGDEEVARRPDGFAHAAIPHIIYDHLYSVGYFGPNFNRYVFSPDQFSPERRAIPRLSVMSFGRM